MAKITEKRLYAVSPKQFITNGNAFGAFEISDSSVFVVGHLVIIKSNTQPPIIAQVKRISNQNLIEVGDPNKPIQDRSINLSAYLVADNATVEATEQNRPIIPQQEVERITYQEEPAVARRAILVDKFGNVIDNGNPLAVNATVSTSVVRTPIIYNPIALLANTEYSQPLPDNTDQLMVKARNNARLQIAYSPSTSIQFLTIWPGSIYKITGVKLIGKTLYFRASLPNTVIEIETWIP
jgi:hypothetical protein